MRITFLTILILLSGRRASFAQQDTTMSRQSLLDSAKVLESQKNYSSAILLYRLAVNRNPEDVETRTFLARDMSWQGNLDSALDEYRQVLSANPDYYDALVGYATVLSWKGDYEGSLEKLKELLVRYPNNARLLLLAARVSLWAGSADDAVSFARMSLENDSTATDALLILAQAYEKKLDFDSAEESVERLLILDPDNGAARRLRAALLDEFRNKVALSVYNENFGPMIRFSNKIVSLSYDRRFSCSVDLFAGIAWRYIFSSSDVAATIGGVFRISEKFIIDSDFLFGPATSTAQRERGSIGLTYNIADPLSVSGSYQYLQFKGTGVSVLSPAINYYFSPSDMILLRAYFGSTTDQGSSASVLARLSLGLSDNILLRVSGFHGAEFYRLVSQSYLSIIATGGSVGARYTLVRGVDLGADVDYTSWKSSPWKHSYGGSLNLLYGW